MILNESEFKVGSTTYSVVFDKYYKQPSFGKKVEITKEEYDEAKSNGDPDNPDQNPDKYNRNGSFDGFMKRRPY